MKATSGHDENITADEARDLCGGEPYDRAAAAALAIYRHAVEHARPRGIVVADTKFEFGLDAAGELVLGDEVLTPDSSRFWPSDAVVPGRARRASTSSTCATGSKRSRGTRRIPARSFRATSPRGWPRATARRTTLLAGRPFSAYLEEQGVECA